MAKNDRDPGRGQLHKRSARAWRDEANPTGPGVASDDVEEDEEEADDAATAEVAPAASNEDEPVNASPGSGGATESALGHKEHEGQHGGPSSKT